MTRPMIWIHASGASLVVAGLSVVTWLAFMRNDPARTVLADLGREIPRLKAELSSRAAEADRLHAIGMQYRRELEGMGRLPEEAPIEENLQTITAMARQFGLNVTANQTLPSRDYLGVREARIRLVISGATQDIGRLLHGIEQAPMWADVGYLQISDTSTAGRAGEPAPEARSRQASLIISIFSSPDSAGDSIAGG